MTIQPPPYVGIHVAPPIRPRWWVRVKNISGMASGVFETEDVELKSERLIPAYSQAELDAAMAAERKRVLAVVEQRLQNWRQRTMNLSGDRLALDDFMGQESIDDLIDCVCDELGQVPRGAA